LTNVDFNGTRPLLEASGCRIYKMGGREGSQRSEARRLFGEVPGRDEWKNFSLKKRFPARMETIVFSCVRRDGNVHGRGKTNREREKEKGKETI